MLEQARWETHDKRDMLITRARHAWHITTCRACRHVL